MNFKPKGLLFILFVALYNLIGILPNYGAIDRIDTQWLALSILNLLGLIYISANYNSFEISIKKALNFKPFLLLVLFTVWGLLSYFYAENSVEVIIKSFRWFNVALAILISCCLLDELKNAFLYVAIILSSILLIQLYFSYSTFFQITEFTNFDFKFSNLLRGASANKNIGAASILIKVPFLFYLLSRTKNLYIRIGLSILLYSSLYLIFLLSARSAVIAVALVLSIYIIYVFLQFYHSRSIKQLVPSICYVIAPALLSIGFFQLNYSSLSEVSLINRATTINTEDTSTKQRIRFYEYAFNHTVNNPVIGVGLGNWKIKSIDYDKNYVTGYTAPYFVHNDFLEFAAELDLIGFFLYLSIFGYMLFFVVKTLFKKDTSGGEIGPKSLILLIGGVIYFVDANLNFPHARLLMQLPFIFYVALFFLTHTKTQNEKA